MGQWPAVPPPLVWAAVDNGALFKLDEWALGGEGKSSWGQQGPVGGSPACLSLTLKARARVWEGWANSPVLQSTQWEPRKQI